MIQYQIHIVHYQLVTIYPFEDGNGRVVRLIMFKECLKYNIVPFIIEDTFCRENKIKSAVCES